MRIETHVADRKTLANAISECIHESSHYDGVPRYTYSIGPVTIERDGAINCSDADVWAALTPFFESHGWLEQAQEQMGEHLETLSEAPTDADTEAIIGTCVSLPIGGATPANLINLLRTLYARQKLINAMTQSDKLFIDEELITLLNEIKPDSREKICEILYGEIRANMVCGVAFLDDRISIEFPHSEEDPTSALGSVTEPSRSTVQCLPSGIETSQLLRCAPT